MNRLIERIAPHATQLVRRDHALVLETFHRYRASASPTVRQALAQSICLALEVHTRIEEELLYPAVREASDSDFLRRAVPEHEEMRRLIAQLRRMPPSDPDYDTTFLALMRRRLALMAPRSADLAFNRVRAAPGRSLLLVAGLALGAAMMGRYRAGTRHA